MKRQQVTFAALATLLIGAALWSCDKEKTPPASVDIRSAQEQQAPPTMPSGGMPGTDNGMMDMNRLRAGCPMAVQGTDVSVVDTEGGVALTFTTDAGDVADLRTRVRNMARMYEMHRGQDGGMMWHHMGDSGMGHGGPGTGGAGMGHGGMGMGGGGMGMGGSGGMGMGPTAEHGSMPAVSNTVTDTEEGARLELRPTDPSQLDALREHVRRHREKMHSGECWMSKGEPTATPRGEQE